MTLTDADALKLRQDYLEGASIAELAEKYWLKPAIVQKIAIAKKWSPITPYLDRSTPPKIPPRKLYPIEIKSIRALYTRGQYSQRQLARKFHITRSRVQRILKGTDTCPSPTKSS